MYESEEVNEAVVSECLTSVISQLEKEFLNGPLLNEKDSYVTKVAKRDRMQELVAGQSAELDPGERARLLRDCISKVFTGLDALLADPHVEGISVNGTGSVYSGERGHSQLNEFKFESNEHLKRVIDELLEPLQLTLDEAHPMVSPGFMMAANLKRRYPRCL